MHPVDVIVIGLGGMGSATLDALAGRGLRVLGLEQFALGHTRGSGHGRTRIVRQAYFENPAYIPLLRRAYQLWDSFPQSCRLQRVGCLSLGSADSAVVSGALESAGIWDVHVEALDRAAVEQRFPQFRLRPADVGLFEPDAGFVRPEETIAFLQGRAEQRGAVLLSGQTVLGWEQDRAGVVVRTGAADYRARRLVITAGAWAPRLQLGAALPIQVQRRVMFFFRPAVGAPAFAGAGLPTYIWDLADGDRSDAIYGFPADADGGVKIAFHDRGGSVDPDHPPMGATAAEEAELRAVADERLPGLAGELIRSVGCHYDLSPDRDFVLGAVPDTDDQVLVAAGFSGHGFKFVPVIGELLADLATTGETDLDVGFLSPRRFQPTPSAP